MKILFVSSEIYPLIKTGGLADVANNLPVALKNRRQAVRVLIPAYQRVMESVDEVKTLAEFSVGARAVRLLETHMRPSRLKVWLLDCPEHFDRQGSPYVDDHGHDWPDNAPRFDLFCQAAASIAMNEVGLQWQSDIVHCNDWQTGLVPIYLQQRPGSNRPRTVFTIHNLAYQGLFSYQQFLALDLPHELWSPEALEFYGQLSFIKGGLVFADRVTTVSPRYATEIVTPKFGCGLEGVLQSRGKHLIGILNGIDDQEWNPAGDPALIQNYSTNNLWEKSKNKFALQHQFNWPESDDKMLIGVVSRLYHQKGIDLLLNSIEAISTLPVQLIILGSGDAELEQGLTAASQRYPDTLAVEIGYDEVLAHRIIAGADVFAMPSRYEPCGLTQLYSLRYGTLPLVRNVGGLADTVVNANADTIANHTADGFAFDAANEVSLQAAVRRAVDCFSQPALWQQLQQTAMRRDFSWRTSAREYLYLYRELVNGTRPIDRPRLISMML